MSPLKQNGSSVVEFAIVLPLLLFLIFVVFEFGTLLYRHNAVTKSVQIAARYLSDVSVAQANTPTDKINAQNLAIYGNIAGTGEALVPGLTSADIVITNPNPQHVRVVATYGSDFILGNTLDALLELATGDDRCINFLEDCPDFMTLTASSVMRFAQ